MSGIAVLFHRDGRPVFPDSIDAMLAAAPYRGPDGTRTFSHESIALGHAKMAVTPEDHVAQQPLISSRTGCTIVADMRLDNRADLLARLQMPIMAPCSDAEIVLRAYEAWGLEALSHLLGDFAFLLWNPRDQRLVCARDTSGQRTLYYRVDRGTFAAASEIQQLFQDPLVPIRPNDGYILEQLAPVNLFRNEKDSSETYFDGIHAVPAGHVLTVDRENCCIRRYWDFNPPSEIRYRTDEEYAEHFRHLFFDVVQARLRSTYPVGVMLSGGLDSSSVACTAQRLYQEGRAEDHGFMSFSFVFDGLECDERPLIEDMQSLYGFGANYISPGEYAGRLQLEGQGFREGPNMGPSEPRDALGKVATQAGVRAMLTGDWGDCCIYGSRVVFDSLLRRGDLAAFRRHLAAYRRTSDESMRKIIALYCVAPLLPLRLQRRITTAYLERVLRGTVNSLLPHWIAEPLRSAAGKRHVELVLEAERARRFSSETREREYRLLYPPELARHPAPWSLEMWRPFADRRLHDFLLAIPSDQKFEPHPRTDEYYAGSKRLLRNAMRGILPESVRTRTTKTVFTPVWDQELARHWPKYEAAFGPTARSEIAQRGYVDQEQFWSRLVQARSGALGGDAMYLHTMVDLETWLRGLNQPRAQLLTISGQSSASGTSLHANSSSLQPCEVT